MVVALLALALVMLVGGVASVVQGFPYVRLESGLAMVIGGASAASAGAILLGLAAAVDRLRRIEQALRADGAPRAFAAPQPDVLPPPAATAPALAGAAGLAGLTVGALGLTASRKSDMPDVAPPIDIPRSTRPEREPPLPDLLPEPVPAASAPEPASPSAEDDLFVEPEPTAAEIEAAGQLSLRPSLEQAEASAPKAEAAEDKAKPAAEELQVVGTYASGGNTYVMFSNGSIEADTPRGRFTFDSLDELKVFVEAGGESGTRGAA